MASDREREFCHQLAKLFGIRPTYSDQNTKPFGGVTPTPRANRSIGRIGGVASHMQRYAGNPAARSMVIRQATRAVAAGKINVHTATKRLDVSLARRAPTVVSGPITSGGGANNGASGWSGSPSQQLGTPATAGNVNYGTNMTTAAPQTPTPLNHI